MLEGLKRFFAGLASGGGETGASGSDDPRVCAAALLVEAALADGIYADVEEVRIREVVADVFAMTPEETAKLLDEAEGLAEEAVDHHRFTKVVKLLPLDQRERIVEALWRVVFADGEESAFEEAYVRRITDLLHVDPRTSRLARQRAAGEEDAGGPDGPGGDEPPPAA